MVKQAFYTMKAEKDGEIKKDEFTHKVSRRCHELTLIGFGWTIVEKGISMRYVPAPKPLPKEDSVTPLTELNEFFK
jgi:hypothetical protein